MLEVLWQCEAQWNYERSISEFAAYVRARHDSLVWKRMKVYLVTASDGLHCVLLSMTLALRVGMFNVCMLSAALFVWSRS